MRDCTHDLLLAHFCVHVFVYDWDNCPSWGNKWGLSRFGKNSVTTLSAHVQPGYGR